MAPRCRPGRTIVAKAREDDDTEPREAAFAERRLTYTAATAVVVDPVG